MYIHMTSSGTWHPPSAPLVTDAPAPEQPPESAYFLQANRNKRSITVNLKAPEGLEIVHKLVKKSDILIENYLPGKLASMGLGWADCQKINPRLVYASVTGTFDCVHCGAGIFHVGQDMDRLAHTVRQLVMMLL